jgi:hypothetical protein
MNTFQLPMNRSYCRTGATTVEFAISAPVLFLLVFAGIEFCQVNVVRHATLNAAYEATRAVIVPGANADEARQAAMRLLNAAGINNAEITFDPEFIDEETIFVTTQISVPISESGWGLGFVCGNTTIDVETTLRTERAPIIQASGLPTALWPSE